MKLSAQLAVASILSSLSLAAQSTIFPIEMVRIPSGHFYMGSPARGENFDDGPVHKVFVN